MRRRSCLVLSSLAAGILAGCGGDDNSSSSSETVTITGTEYSFNAPSSIEGGLTHIEYENVGAEPHEFALAKLSGDKTADDVARAIKNEKSPNGPPPPWVSDAGGVSTLTPGAALGVTRDLAPGNYALLCFLPSPKGVPHVNLGMISGFTVSGDSGDKAPSTDGAITATDKSFDVSELASGEQTIKLENTAKTKIGFNLIGLNPGKSISDVGQWFNSGLQGKPPATVLGITQFLNPGETQYVDVDLQPDTTYVIIDPDHGLKKTFTTD